MGRRLAQDLERKGEQGVAGENRRCLVEGLVYGWTSAAQVVVVHGWQVVVHQRVAMDAFDGSRSIQSLLLRYTEEGSRLDDQERPKALAAAKRGIAHGFGEPAWCWWPEVPGLTQKIG
jgi:hypothetical protein